MSTTTWDTPEFAAVVEFATDKVEYFYVRMGAAYHYIAKKCEDFIHVIQNSLFTYDGYKIETLNKVFAALEAEPIEVPSDKDGYFAWLKNPQK